MWLALDATVISYLQPFVLKVKFVYICEIASSKVKSRVQNQTNDFLSNVYIPAFENHSMVRVSFSLAAI